MSVIKATTLSNLAGSKTVPTDTVVDGSAKAWVNFNGTGTVAIRRAFNVSSITDNGTGDYTVNFTNAMVNANYSVGGSSSVGTLDTAETRVGVLAVLSVLAASVRVLTPQNSDNGSNPGYRDYQLNSVAIFS